MTCHIVTKAICHTDIPIPIFLFFSSPLCCPYLILSCFFNKNMKEEEKKKGVQNIKKINLTFVCNIGSEGL